MPRHASPSCCPAGGHGTRRWDLQARGLGASSRLGLRAHPYHGQEAPGTHDSVPKVRQFPPATWGLWVGRIYGLGGPRSLWEWPVGGDLVRMQVLWEAGQMVPFPAAPGGRSCWSQTPLRAGQSRAAPAEGRPGVPRPGVQRGCAGLSRDMLWDPGRSPSGHFAARMLYFYCFSFSGCENVNDLRRSGRAGRRSKSAPVSSRALGSAGSGGSPRAFWAGRHSRAAVSAGGRRCHVLACLGPRHRGASAQRLGQPPDPGSVDSWVLPQGGQGRG